MKKIFREIATTAIFGLFFFVFYVKAYFVISMGSASPFRQKKKKKKNLRPFARIPLFMICFSFHWISSYFLLVLFTS